jgi:hypothetical protein
VKLTASEVSKVVNETIIPGVRASATAFGKFMKGLTDYVSGYVQELIEESAEPIEPTEEVSKPKTRSTAKVKPPVKQEPKPKRKPKETKFSLGEGSDKISIEFDPTVPLTEDRLNTLLVDLANTVLAIDEAVPKLDSDLSLYRRLALRTGVFTGGVAPAAPAAEPTPEEKKLVVSSTESSFRVSDVTELGTKFDVPRNGVVAVTSSAYYDTDVDVRSLDKSIRPSLVYRIVLGRGKEAVSVPRQYNVNQSETGEWYNLDKGRYYLWIEKGGNPNFVLEGKLQIVVKRSE